MVGHPPARRVASGFVLHYALYIALRYLVFHRGRVLASLVEELIGADPLSASRRIETATPMDSAAPSME